MARSEQHAQKRGLARRRGGAIGSEILLAVDPNGPLSLQNQIRRQIIAAIAAGVLPPDHRMPSTRSLAGELGIARNTIALAYEDLIADGHLTGRERSGVFVSKQARGRNLEQGRVVGNRDGAGETVILAGRLVPAACIPSVSRIPPDWHRYPFPFLDGRFDRTLFPIAQWREANRLALSIAEVSDWSSDSGDADDPLLVEQIRTKVLAARGVLAARNEVLILGSVQQALHILAMLLLRPGARAAVEEPGLAETRALLGLAGATVVLQPVDDEGMVVDERLADVDLIYVTASRQRPTGVTLSRARRAALLELAQRQGMFIVEDDFDHESTFLARPLAAMRSMKGGGQVIYVSSLARGLAPGVRLAFMCGPAELIAEARRLRDLATHRPSPLNQRAAGHFLALGHFEAMNNRVLGVVQERLLALRDALNHYLPKSIAAPLSSSVAISPVEGGSAVWVEGPANLDARSLAVELERRGVLIEPASDYFAGPEKPHNMFRLGASSIPADKIRAGVRLIAAVIREMTSGNTRESGPLLSGTEIRSRLAGKTLLYRTVYGEPCTISVGADGTLEGRAGSAGDDVDNGRWWVEGNSWVRQWTNWAYGEASAFGIVVEGNSLFWLDTEGRYVDSAVIAMSTVNDR
jgi:GntR family transcriptional regulator/MocR family aminotransferase